MNNSDETSPPSRPSRRPGWLLGVALVALAGLVFSVAGLRSNQDTAAAGDPVRAALTESMAQAESPTAQSMAVDIKNYAFSPSSLTVSVGDTVTWTNEDTAPHTVTVSDGPVKFASPTLQQGQTFSYTFTQAGTYSYYCAVHPDMKATVTVTGGSTTTPPPPSSSKPSSQPTTSMSMPSSSTGSSPSSSISMPMPSTGTSSPDSGCVSKEVLEPIWAHIQSAHLEASPGQQVSDLLNLDQYIKTHTVWLEQVLSPVFNGSADKVVTDTLAPIWAHIQSAHLETSLGQQVSDALNLDQYIKTHTVWLEQVLTPLMNQTTC